MFFFGKKKNGNGKACPADAGPTPEELKLVESLSRLASVYGTWQPRMADMASELNSVSRDTEEEFLAIGASLQNFFKGCSASSSQASSAAAIFEGNDGLGISGFKDLFSHAHAEVESCAAAIAGGISGMDDLMQRIETILELRDFLKKLAHSISVLGTLMRIETARVGESEFNIMTSIVDELAQEIERDGTDIASSAKSARTSLTASRNKMSARIEKFNKDLSANREHVHGIMQELDMMIMQAKFACERIKGRASQISPEVGNVISALQYHDICRQQMEHVGEALGELAAKLSGAGAAGNDEGIALARRAHKVLHIQIRQLEHVIAETAASAESISSHLSRISDIAQAQAEDANLLLEEEDSGSDRIAGIGSELEALSGMLAENKTMVMDMGQAVSDVTATIGGMSRQVANIRMISDNISLLALNTIIKVARTGESGRGLEVLADEIRKISTNAEAEIAKGSGTINAILDTSSQFKRTLSEELEQELVSTEAVFRETRSAVEELMKTDAAMVQLLAEISGGTKKLETEIMELISGIRFADIIKSKLGSIASALKTMLNEIETLMPETADEDPAEPAPELNDLAGRYTMHSERKVHQAALDRIDGGNGSASAGGHAAAAANDLGDNVELF